MEDFHSHLHLVKLYPARPDLIPPAATAHTGPAPLPLNLPPSYNRRRWSSPFFWRPLCKLRLVHGLGTAFNITCPPDSSPLRSTHTLERPAYVTAIGRSFTTTAWGEGEGGGAGTSLSVLRFVVWRWREICYKLIKIRIRHRRVRT